jgi:Ca2+-binding EF-hand superfamily protein
MLQQLGIKVPKFEINRILEKHDRNKDGHLNKEEFEDVRITLKKTI